MGLCKCPKRKVTNLFCFEHRVNVCEDCLVDSHESCVVQSYLAWLTDSDFDPNCVLCSHLLGTGETVRLQCLHVFHWNCLNSRMKELPSTTAPAGYTCPCCKEAVFPAPNQVSPVIDRLRATLLKANWARNGLGIPILPELDSMQMPEPVFTPQPPATPQPQPTRSARDTPTVVEVDSYIPAVETQFTSRSKGTVTFEEPSSNEASRLLGRDADSPENKYKRRPASEFLTRWFRSRMDNRGLNTPIGGGRRRLFLFILIVFALVTFFTILSRNGYLGPSADDPMFDPKANPHIRAEDVAAKDVW
uniref:Zinc finger protein-like 1 homolog n=1 Tax=Steinernema glaseri TaxID=37863 RepID=A0A1I7YRE2_9BILA